MDVVFFGSSPFGLPALEMLAGRHTVRAIVTQPDRPAGRKRVPTATPIGSFAAERLAGVPVLKPESCNEPGVVERLRVFPADVWVVIAYGQKLSEKLLEGVTAINLHASILPRHRGAAPINAAILAGDTETGNSVIALAQKMDAGDVYRISRTPIGDAETAADLHDRLAETGADDIAAVLEEIESGRARPESQDHERATLAPKLSPADAWVDWAGTVDAARRRINALQPKPGVNAVIGGHEVKLRRAASERAERVDQATGRVVDAAEGLIALEDRDALLRVLEVQPVNARVMPWSAFAAGRDLSAGDEVCTPG